MSNHFLDKGAEEKVQNGVEKERDSIAGEVQRGKQVQG